jgi:hypothetical protein
VGCVSIHALFTISLSFLIRCGLCFYLRTLYYFLAVSNQVWAVFPVQQALSPPPAPPHVTCVNPAVTAMATAVAVAVAVVVLVVVVVATVQLVRCVHRASTATSPPRRLRACVFRAKAENMRQPADFLPASIAVARPSVASARLSANPKGRLRRQGVRRVGLLTITLALVNIYFFFLFFFFL